MPSSFDDDWDDPQDFEPDDDFDSDDPSEEIPMARCPQCGGEVLEDAQICPHCDQFITAEYGGMSEWPAWAVALGVAGVIATILALVGAFLLF